MPEVICRGCASPFLSTPANRKLCSEKCRESHLKKLSDARVARRKAGRDEARQATQQGKTCCVCGTDMSARKATAKYCGMPCWRASNVEAVKRHAKKSDSKCRTQKRAYYAKWLEENRERVLANKREYNRRRYQSQRAYQTAYREKNRESLRIKIRGRYQRNKVKITEKQRRRKAEDPAFRLISCLRSYLWAVLKKADAAKTQRTVKLLGCTPSAFILHIQALFTKEMNWGNQGKVWQLDHIVPCAAFDHSDPMQVASCWHYMNLRPLNTFQNLSEGARGFRKGRHQDLAP